MFKLNKNEFLFIIPTIILGIIMGYFIKEGIDEVLKIVVQSLIAFGSVLVVIYILWVQFVNKEYNIAESKILNFYNFNKVEILKRLGELSILKQFKDEEQSEIRPPGVELKIKDQYLDNFRMALDKQIDKRMKLKTIKSDDIVWDLYDLRNRAFRASCQKFSIGIFEHENNAINSMYLTKIYLIWIMIPIVLIYLAIFKSYGDILIIRIIAFFIITYSLLLILRSLSLIYFKRAISKKGLNSWVAETEKKINQISKGEEIEKNKKSSIQEKIVKRPIFLCVFFKSTTVYT